MRRYQQRVSLYFVVAIALSLAGGWTSAQEKGTPQEKGGKAADKPAEKLSKESPTKDSGGKAASSRRRLPRYYGKLGLSEAQREKIYGVQEKHAADIEKLEKQLADLKEKQEAECRKVLTTDQKKQLTETLDAARTRSKGKDESDEMEG